MPPVSWISIYDIRRESDRQKAWKLHYQLKGASESKAAELARRKVIAKQTWPIGQTTGDT